MLFGEGKRLKNKNRYVGFNLSLRATGPFQLLIQSRETLLEMLITMEAGAFDKLTSGGPSWTKAYGIM